ncbi:MAG: hypothetical protein HFE63_03765 [Clostridiales bacterium]|nr:hypothetical protein [Clostridiales bacterium]
MALKLHSNRISAALMAALLTAIPAVSCTSSTENTGGGTNGITDTDTDSSAMVTESVTYPDVDYEGAEFRILNFDQLWNMYIHIDAAELNGEVLNDAVYNRNRKIEKALNCKIVEKTFENDTANTINRITDHAKTSIMSNEDEYDVMFLPVNEAPDLITDGYLLDLNMIPELHLDEEWWDQDIIRETTFGDRLYFVSGAANLMAFDSMWCLFFNETMMGNLQLELPYDLVREGKWTIDEMTKYCKAAANLNGDNGFTYNKDGSCVWGISSHQQAPQHFWFSAGESTVSVDKNKQVSFALENDRFYRVISKLANMLDNKEGYTLRANNTDFDVENGGYVHVFTTGRSLFMTGEVKAAQLMRDMEDTFGIVPFPKYDEEQSQYYTSLVSQLFYLTIPTTNSCLERTATIANILTRDSYNDIIPLYYSNVVEQKGLRNEDSIDMLGILRETRAIDIATIFNWNLALRNEIDTRLFAGNDQVASYIASQKNTVEANMKKFFDFLTE